MCSASTSTRNDSPITTSSIASSKSSAKRDMCAPFWCGSRSIVHSTCAAISFSRPAWRRRIAFSTPVTPTRDSAIGTSGAVAWRSCSMSRRVAMERCLGPKLPGGISALTDFARIVTLACHDLRTPLATVRGFAKTLQRTAPEEGPEGRYLELIDAASAELAHLLDLLGLLARREAGRLELSPVDANTGTIARAAAAETDGAVEVVGEGENVAIDAALVEQAL